MIDPEYQPLKEAKNDLEFLANQIKIIKEKIKAGIRTVEKIENKNEEIIQILDLLEEIHKNNSGMIEMVNIKLMGIDVFSESEPIFPYLI